jgi:hypothetical protein|tara:strand:- start:1556 stop:2473 length:918 start_codon:yes stop_codon:yes gene_type:complete
MKNTLRAVFICVLAFAWPGGTASAEERQPIIDIHMHPVIDMAPLAEMLSVIDLQGLRVSDSGDALLAETLELLDHYNIVKVILSGDAEAVAKWRTADPKRFIPALQPQRLTADPAHAESLRPLFESGKMEAFGEVSGQYLGFGPDDQAYEPYFALAEEFDIPFGVHMGMGPPGAVQTIAPTYRARLGDPLLLEEVIVRHPKLRVYVMHAGWPMIDNMIAVLYNHPSVYVDVSLINWHIPRKEFHYYLRRLVEAGFGERIMWGSDHGATPDAIHIAVEAIESADFLSAEQKRDIFYNNAVRFLRLD